MASKKTLTYFPCCYFFLLSARLVMNLARLLSVFRKPELEFLNSIWGLGTEYE
jgi:hypothetical protein